MRLLPRANRLSWQVRFYALALVFVALMAMLFNLMLKVLAAQPTNAPVPPPHTLPNTDVNPYGANFFLSREVEPWKLDRTLFMATEAGIGWVKQQFTWEDIEPRRKGEFVEPVAKGDSWAKYDHIVELCEKYGLQIVARLDRPPDWTRRDNTYKERPPDNYEDYGDFVYTFVKHYQGRIHYIQLWNEPNIFPEWGNQPVDPAQYVELLKIGYRRAKEADPNIQVLSAPLAYTLGQPHPEPGKWISMNDLDYLEGMYKAGAKDYFDIYCANAFGMDRPPEDPPDPNVLNFQRVLLQRKIMERYGDRDKAVWFNEYGWNAAPEDMPEDRLIWKRVTEKQQAEYTLRGIDLARREWPWAGVFMIWYFRQVGHIPVDRADHYFGMVDPDFSPRPVYLAVQDATAHQKVAATGYYQQTNPSIRPYGRWRQILDPGASAGSYIVADTPGDSVAVMFQGDGVDLITRTGPGAGRLAVSLDGHPAPGLAVDAQGRSYLDLYAPSWQAQARVPLVRNIAPGEHTLRLTVHDTRHAAAIGSECAVDAIEVVAPHQTPFPLAMVLALVAGLSLDTWLLSRAWQRVRWLWRSP